MPNQSKIIYAVNLYLKQIPNIDVELNKVGVCSGLSSLYIKYALENKSAMFFSILQQLSELSPDYNMGDNPMIDKFISEIISVHYPHRYSKYQIEQGDIDKILHINHKPIRNEFNFGLITRDERWEDLLTNIVRPNRSYFLASTTHAIALTFKNGHYVLYDPNYEVHTKTYQTAKEVVQEIKSCLYYKNTSFGLSIRSFANPDAPFSAAYPTNEWLRTLAFQDEADILFQSIEEGKAHRSMDFALGAKDSDTLAFLFNKKAIQYEQLNNESYLCNVTMTELILRQPRSSELQAVIRQAIRSNIWIGNTNLVEQLINQYNQFYASPEDAVSLASTLKSEFSGLHQYESGMMSKENDYTYFLQLFEKYNYLSDPNTLTNYNHLKLISLLNSKTHESHGLFISMMDQLTTAQLMMQIYVAALSNNQIILSVCLNQAITKRLSLHVLPSIFDENLLKKISSQTLKKLLSHEMMVDPGLLAVYLKNRDKSLFQDYLNAFLKQTKQLTLAGQLNQPAAGPLNLQQPLGPITLLDALIVLKKNQTIMHSWQDPVDDSILKEALFNAILHENEEISLFLKEKLDTKHLTLDIEKYKLLLNQAIKENNLSLLSLLTGLNFNILNAESAGKIWSLCDCVNDFSVICDSLKLASHPIKLYLLEGGLDNNSEQLNTFYFEKEPEITKHLLLEIVNRENSSQRDQLISKFHDNLHVLPPETMVYIKNTLNMASLKSFIRYCFAKNLLDFLDALCIDVEWGDAELEQLLRDCIVEKNEKAIIKLITIYPHLQQSHRFINKLLQRNLLIVIDKIFEQPVAIDEAMYPSIFDAALLGNNPKLIEKLIDLRKLPAQPKLSQDLCMAIKSGHALVIDVFIQSKLDLLIDFKALFLTSCEHQQANIANQLLIRDIRLNEEEITLAIHTLFDSRSPQVIYNAVYKEVYGRLYGLLLKTLLQNPQEALLRAIKDPHRDAKFQKSALYLSLLNKALIEKNLDKFNQLFLETALPEVPDHAILDFIEAHLPNQEVLSLFERKYPWESLLTIAIEQRKWDVVAILLETHTMDALAPDIQQNIAQHSDHIVSAFIHCLDAVYTKQDVRPRLFNLLNPISPPNGLKSIAAPYHGIIHEAMVNIELKMIDEKLNLNKQVYRHTMSNRAFENALIELEQTYQQCAQIIATNHINLALAIDNQALIQSVCHMKELLAQHDITPYYLTEAQQELLETLAVNPQLKKVYDLEIKLVYLMRAMSVKEKTLAIESPHQQKFIELLAQLDQALTDNHLAPQTVIPDIQNHLTLHKDKIQQLQLQQQQNHCIDGLVKVIEVYMGQRNKEASTHHWLPFFQHTKTDKINAASQLIHALKHPETLISKENRAILTDGRLKTIINRYVVQHEHTFQRYFKCHSPMKTVEQLMHHLDLQSPVGKLIDILEQYKKERAEKLETYYPSFLCQYTKTDKLKAVNQLIYKLKNENYNLEPKDLKALSQGKLGALIGDFIKHYKVSLSGFLDNKPMNTVDDLIQVCHSDRVCL